MPIVKEQDYLEHYGRLGMKWYQHIFGDADSRAKYSNRDLDKKRQEAKYGHTIEKGTTVYRVSRDGASKLSGATYVTYLPPDRDLYRGTYSKQLALNQGGKVTDQMVESKYELKEDLKIPSRDEVRKVYSEIMQNDNLKKEACKGLATGYVKSWEWEYRFNYGDDWKKAMKKDIEMSTNDFLNAYGKFTPDQAFSMVARSMGPSNPVVKKAAIDILSAKGYNAMVDEAGVGGLISPKEGVEPLIVFNAKSSMNKVDQTAIDQKTIDEANKRYREWKQKANANKSVVW